MRLRHSYDQERIGSPNFGGIFFKGPKKKIADQKKKVKNGAIGGSKQVLSRERLP
jgi:hypothetical protein